MSLARMLAGSPRAEVTWSPLDDRWYSSSPGLLTESGVVVTEASALRVATVYRAVSVLASSLAMCPAVVYERLPRGKRPAPQHPVARMLSGESGGAMTPFVWMRQTMTDLLLRGNSYHRIVGPGTLSRMAPERVGVDVLYSGRLRYVYAPPAGQQEKLTQDEVLHFRSLSLDGLVGVSAFEAMRQSVGLSLAAELHAARLYAQGTTIAGVLKQPGQFSSPEVRDRVRASWEAATSGASGRGKTAILEEGVEFQQLAITQRDAQFVEGLSFRIGEFLRFIGVPAPLAGWTDDKSATFASASAMDQFFAKYTVAPWAVNIAQQLWASLIGDPRYFIEFTLEALLRGDLKARADAYRVMLDAGVLNRAQVRDMESYDPGPAHLERYSLGSGTVLLDEEGNPSGFGAPATAPVVGAGSTPAQATTFVSATHAQRVAEQLLRGAAERVFRREVAAIVGSESKGTKGGAARYAGDAVGWAAWCAEHYRALSTVIVETMAVTPECAEKYCRARLEALRDGVACVEAWSVGDLLALCAEGGR